MHPEKLQRVLNEYQIETINLSANCFQELPPDVMAKTIPCHLPCHGVSCMV